MSAPSPDPAKKPRRRRSSTPGRRAKKRVEGLLGVGLDGTDGHTRITKGEHFLLLGGSAETHERMQDLTIRINERLAKRGKRIPDATLRELRDLVDDLRS